MPRAWWAESKMSKSKTQASIGFLLGVDVFLEAAEKCEPREHKIMTTSL